MGLHLDQEFLTGQLCIACGLTVYPAEAETMAGVFNGPEALIAVFRWRVTHRTGHHALGLP